LPIAAPTALAHVRAAVGGGIDIPFVLDRIHGNA